MTTTTESPKDEYAIIKGMFAEIDMKLKLTSKDITDLAFLQLEQDMVAAYNRLQRLETELGIV